MLVCALMVLPLAASAATTNFIAGAGYAAGSAAVPTTVEFQTGSGSWYKNFSPGDPVVEFYIDPVSQFGTTFTIDDIADIRYWTKNDGTNPSGVDFFMAIYTVPDGVDDDGWYGRRLNAEPYLANTYAPVANTWVEWSAASPLQNQLTWFDSNNCGNFGFYNAPTLADLKAGAITWTDYPGAGAGADPNPIDYGSETVLYFKLGTGSGWASMVGYLDAVEFELTNGDVFVFDLEGPADPIYVDDDWAGLAAGAEVAPGQWLGYNAYDTVQNGVNFALTQVFVAEGTYPEQVVIDKDLEVVGAGIGLSTILSPATLDFQFSTSYNYYPVVTAKNATVDFRGFTIDGDGQGNAHARFVGIGYYNASGELAECETTGTRNEPLDGSQHGVGIYGLYDDGAAHTMVCRDNVMGDFQKNGMAWSTTGATTLDIQIIGCDVTGSPGMTADNGDPAQNGIQVYGAGVTALIDGNTVSGIGYDNTSAATKWVATSILDYFATSTISNNLIVDAQTAAYTIESPVSYLNNDVNVVRVGESAYGIIASDPPAAVPAPFDGVDPHAQSAGRRAGVFAVVLDGNTVSFTGVDNTGSIGMEVDAGYYDFLGDGGETLDVDVTNNTVSGFETGMAVLECTDGCTGSTYGTIDIHNNDFGGNVYGLYTDAFSATVDASCNWWGDVSGPTAVDNVLGTGALIEGSAIYEPWLDGPAGACVLSSDYVYAGPAPSEIAGCTDCVLVPVTLFRSDTNAARGVSVTFELSPELELCGTPTISLGGGTFYDGFAGQVQEFLLDNGGGSYTFDSSILGSPCGPTVGGEVFAIPVTYAAGLTGDATGTVTISSVTLRDCANAPLPALPGSGATIEIDLTAPGPVTNLAATQQVSGNDADGTTAISLTWDLPADADVTTMELYRKGFGFYPEYDDAGGAAPTPPTDPADALANGWVLAETIAPGATSVSTEAATRDFWYFVMFVNDECYTSAVSNQTAGTLGYHLGDVAPGAGDNGVATIDVSALGAAYGTVDGDGLYDAQLDVGPTTDFSVNALPTTDDAVQFEDLMMFAINYGQVSRPVDLDIAAMNELALVAPQALAEGERVSVPIRMAGDGTLQGVSVTVDWNRDVLEYVGYAEGDLGERNGAPVFSARPGVIDAAVLGAAGQGLSGEGVLATLRFRVRAAGDPGLVIREIDARNGENEKVTLDGRVIGDTPTNSAVVRRSALQPNVPNPFNPRTTVFFDVAVAGRVDVRVYSLSGRLVRTLMSGDMTVGNHQVVWDGIDDAGRSVASGTYLVRLVARDRTDSRSMVLLK
jgi:hypothetical protein